MSKQKLTLDLDDLFDHSKKVRPAPSSFRKKHTPKPSARPNPAYRPPPFPADPAPDASILYWRRYRCRQCDAVFESPRFAPSGDGSGASPRTYHCRWLRIHREHRAGDLQKWDFIPHHDFTLLIDLPHIVEYDEVSIPSCPSCHCLTRSNQPQLPLDFQEPEQLHYQQLLHPETRPEPEVKTTETRGLDMDDFKHDVETIKEKWSLPTQAALGEEVATTFLSILDQRLNPQKTEQ